MGRCRRVVAAGIALAAAIAACGCAGSWKPGDFDAGARPLAPKVLVIIHNPIIEAEGGKRLIEVAGWNNPDELVRGYIADIHEASAGFVRYQVVERIEVDGCPVKKDGFAYDDETYLACLRGKQKWRQPDGVDYKKIIEEFKIVPRVEAGELDEVWLLGAPYYGYWESTMAGEGAYYCNSDPVEGVACKRRFVIMGFNYERGVGEMLEDLGHRAESVLWRIFRTWGGVPAPGLEGAVPAKKAEEGAGPIIDHDWDLFTLHEKVAPGRAHCGNVHYAPNSEGDYDWGNPRFVWSACDDWLTYPDLPGTKRLVNCQEWGGGDIRKHHVWWFRHMPRAGGIKDGRLNNWWNYFILIDRFR